MNVIAMAPMREICRPRPTIASCRTCRHHWLFPRLPLGEHGSRRNRETCVGHVRSLVKFFEIPDEGIAKYDEGIAKYVDLR